MTSEQIHAPSVFASPTLFSQAVRAGDFLYISGQGGLSPEGEVQGTTAGEQLRHALENVQEILRSAGATFGDMVKVTIYLTDMGDYAEINEVYREILSEPMPARTCIAAAGLPGAIRIEVDVVAFLKGRGAPGQDANESLSAAARVTGDPP